MFSSSIFRKAPTILLLIIIILISLVFSILLNQPLHEGIDGYGTINNPPPDVIEDLLAILINHRKNNLEKLQEIDKTLGGKYKVLGDIYRENENTVLKELKNVLSKPPAIDSDGNILDKNALVGSEREKAINLLAKNDISGIEKIAQINTLADKDKQIHLLLTEYLKAWLLMLTANIQQIYSTENNIIKPLPSP
jgi:hypothetical protein